MVIEYSTKDLQRIIENVFRDEFPQKKDDDITISFGKGEGGYYYVRVRIEDGGE